jgi:hypothetical protein
VSAMISYPKNDPTFALKSAFQECTKYLEAFTAGEQSCPPATASSVSPHGRPYRQRMEWRYYLGFGTCLALGALFFFFAALAFACFCAACLCVAFGDLSPMSRRVRFMTNGVNTERQMYE